jgi:hypothetical protein
LGAKDSAPANDEADTGCPEGCGARIAEIAYSGSS